MDFSAAGWDGFDGAESTGAAGRWGQTFASNRLGARTSATHHDITSDHNRASRTPATCSQPPQPGDFLFNDGVLGMLRREVETAMRALGRDAQGSVAALGALDVGYAGWETRFWCASLWEQKPPSLTGSGALRVTGPFWSLCYSNSDWREKGADWRSIPCRDAQQIKPFSV